MLIKVVLHIGGMSQKIQCTWNLLSPTGGAAYGIPRNSSTVCVSTESGTWKEFQTRLQISGILGVAISYAFNTI